MPEETYSHWRTLTYRYWWNPDEARRTRRDEYPRVDWVSDGHRENNYKYLDALESKANGVVLLLGAWPDEAVANATNIPIDEIVRGRRLIGAEAVTAERDAEIERTVGPICEQLRRNGHHKRSLDIRRWAALLWGEPDQGKRRAAGAMWWTYENLCVLDESDSKATATKNCYSCRWLRGHHSTEQVYTATCMAPKGFQRIVGRNWYYQRGGSPGFPPARRHTLCPAWKDPIPERRRNLLQIKISYRKYDGDEHLFFKRGWKPFTYRLSVRPFPNKREYHIINSPSWLPLMKLIKERQK